MKTMYPMKLLKALPALFFYIMLWFGFFAIVATAFNPIGWWWVALMVVQILSFLEILHRCTRHCVVEKT